MLNDSLSHERTLVSKDCFSLGASAAELSAGASAAFESDLVIFDFILSKAESTFWWIEEIAAESLSVSAPALDWTGTQDSIIETINNIDIFFFIVQ